MEAFPFLLQPFDALTFLIRLFKIMSLLLWSIKTTDLVLWLSVQMFDVKASNNLICDCLASHDLFLESGLTGFRRPFTIPFQAS